jgi:hypothetical protein
VNGSSPRLPRFRRHRSRQIAFALQERDRNIVELVANYRVVSSAEIQALVPGSAQAILRRLQRLYHAGLLDRPRHQLILGNTRMIYALGARGAQLLMSRGRPAGGDWSEKNRQIKPLALEHGLMIARFRTALVVAARALGSVEVERWSQGTTTWDSIIINHDDWRERIPVCPDAYFVLRLRDEPEGHNRIHVFLEADRGTMTGKRFTTKVRGYWHYWRSEALQRRFGINNFIVATVTRSPERAANLQAAVGRGLAHQRGLRMFVFASEVSWRDDRGCVLDRIWRSADGNCLHTLAE